MKKMYKKPKLDVMQVKLQCDVLLLDSGSGPEPQQQSGTGVPGRRPDITV